MGGLPNPAKTQCFHTLDPASYTLAHAYAHRKSRGSTDRKCNMAMGGLPNPAKTQCFHTLDPASYILAHAYAHRKLRGSTDRKCNMAMGGLPNPAKTQCFPTLDPASYILAHAYAHRKSRGSTDRKCNMAINLVGALPLPRSAQHETHETMWNIFADVCCFHLFSKTVQECSTVPTKKTFSETHRAQHIISYHRLHIELLTLSMYSSLQ